MNKFLFVTIKTIFCKSLNYAYIEYNQKKLYWLKHLRYNRVWLYFHDNNIGYEYQLVFIIKSGCEPYISVIKV